ncbi:MAG: hypothetical protein ACYDAS_02015 [Patescibacteria group bacterium]
MLSNNILTMLFNILFILFAIFTLWLVFYKAGENAGNSSVMVTNNDFWDFIFLLLISFFLGYLILSYIGVVYLSLLCSLLFLRLKTYNWILVFDFYALFMSIILVPYFISIGIVYIFILLLIIVFIILSNGSRSGSRSNLRNLHYGKVGPSKLLFQGYGVTVLFTILSIVYFFNSRLWVVKNNFIYNLDLCAILLTIGLFCLLLKLFLKNEELTFDILKKRNRV